jgi:pimeloyl-ACP methyl ester carboxylesterase
MNMTLAQINGNSIYWEIDGESGDPMVLVHGSWVDHRSWAPVVPALSQSFRVLSYDRRGHSRSQRPTGQGSVREDVADLAALLEELDHAPAHVVGSSFGGSIVLRLATERRDLFRSLIAHEPPLLGLLKNDPDSHDTLATVQERIAAVIDLLIRNEQTAGARQFVETVALGPGSWLGLPQEVRETFVNNASTWLDEVRDPEALEIDLDSLRDFSPPALLTTGDQSPPFFPLVVGQVAAALPQAEIRIHGGAGHVPHQSHPEQYVRLVTDFIDRGSRKREG